jgi:ubiquitin-like modifier-activating enzyme ATG7
MCQAVDLNLRLMRWRLWPDVDTDKLAKTNCLLLGAGTLGCAVARCLLGWGVRRITLVDNGHVSYSNPTRQSLFRYDDAMQRRPKALAAATALQEIFPDMESRGLVFSIPMPGHVSSDGNIAENTDQLHALIKESDVVFALTDSREARWLATTIAAAEDKLLINVALGFDSYLVMRHGGHPLDNDAKEERLGCYFCTDITAAGNSMRDRTLDQQCTVTRPGLSFIAAGLASEMMVALLHRKFSTSKADNDDSDEDPPIPHQIRGSLQDFSQMAISVSCILFTDLY